MGRFDNYQEYLKYVNPNSQQGRQVNKYTGGNYNPYGFSAATGGYEAISNTVESPIDMTQYMQQPDLMTDLSGSLSTASTANKILGTKIGGKSQGFLHILLVEQLEVRLTMMMQLHLQVVKC